MDVDALPSVALAAVPGRRRATVELACEIERRGFTGIYCASFGDAMSLCLSLAHETERIPIGTAIVNLYARDAADYALSAAYLQEISGGRFHFGVGVSHAPMLRRMGVEGGKPLASMRGFVERARAAKRVGDLPPIVVAALRRKMVALAGEIGDGVVFANVARSHVPTSLEAIEKSKREDEAFFVGNMIPTCISDDRAAAAAVNRRTLAFYLTLPNYRNYWKEAGYAEEIAGVEAAIERGERDDLPGLMPERWLEDTTLYGSVDEVRAGVAAWREAGVRTPILVPSSAVGNQMKAFEELFAAFASD